MRAIIEDNETRIRRLRVTSNERDVLALRLHLDRILESADLRPSGLPSGAVMCIRNLRVPTRLPIELRDSRFADEWKASINTSLEQFVRRAARPALEAVPLDARAVIFRDRAQLLACLASDWCRGLVLARWWWQGLFRNQSAGQVVRDSWRATPEYVPAALAQLAKRNLAHQFINKWSNDESLALLQIVLNTFALQELLPVIELARQADNAGQPAFKNESNPPWPSWAASESGLEVGQQLLLSIGLLIQSAPAVVRTRRFARAVMDWQERISAGSVKHAAENDDQRAIREPELNSVYSAARDVRVDPLDEESPVVAPYRGQPSRTVEFLIEEPASASAGLEKMRPADSADTQPRESPPVAQSEVARKGNATARVEAVSELGMQANEPDPASRLDLQSEHSSEQGSLGRESELQASSDIAGEEILETQQQLDTRFGGLFFLLNVGIYLNLYGDFTTPRAAGIELNIWDFVALLGKELVAPDDDPIWPFLAQLAGREADDTPGKGFMPEPDWRVAPDWLTDFSTERPWSWNTSEGRLRVAHPEGFLVLDLALDLADSAGQLQTEIEKYEAALGHSITLKPSPETLAQRGLETFSHQLSPQLREWLARLMPYVRARLRVALGLAEDIAAGAIFCRRQATVRATDTHVDVFFSLADLPLEIRFAGLDRDPGWVPAAGRFIAFHFD